MINYILDRHRTDEPNPQWQAARQSIPEDFTGTREQAIAWAFERVDRVEVFFPERGEYVRVGKDGQPIE